MQTSSNQVILYFPQPILRPSAPGPPIQVVTQRSDSLAAHKARHCKCISSFISQTFPSLKIFQNVTFRSGNFSNKNEIPGSKCIFVTLQEVCHFQRCLKPVSQSLLASQTQKIHSINEKRGVINSLFPYFINCGKKERKGMFSPLTNILLSLLRSW